MRQLRPELGADRITCRWVAEIPGHGLESDLTWLRQAEIDDGASPGVTTRDRASIKVAGAVGTRAAKSQLDLEAGVCELIRFLPSSLLLRKTRSSMLSMCFVSAACFMLLDIA